MTLKEIIEDIHHSLEILTPEQITRYAIDLAVHLINKGDESARASVNFYKVFAKFIDSCGKVSEAEVKAKSTTEFYNKKILENELAGINELIQVLKKRLIVLSDENKGQY